MNTAYAVRKQYQTVTRSTTQGTVYQVANKRTYVDYSDTVSVASIVINTLAVIITLVMVAGLVMMLVK